MKNLITTLTLLIILNSTSLAQNLAWAKSMGGANGDIGHSIVVDQSGNLYSTGFFSGTVDFDPNIGTYNLTSWGGLDIYIQKLDSSGNLLWAKNIGGSNSDSGAYITIDNLGNIYTTGSFRGIVDFDPNIGIHNLTATGGNFDADIFIQKLDTNGNFIWAKSMGSINDEGGASTTIDNLGNIYTTGGFRSSTDFDPNTGVSTLTAVGQNDIFIQKLDANGNFIWVKSMGSTGYDGGESIALDESSNLFTTGAFQDTVDFDPNTGIHYLTAVGGFNSDIYIQKLDSSGNFIWAKSMGGTSADIGRDIVLDDFGNVYTTGYFEKTVDFDPNTGVYNITASGANEYFDIFIQKLDANGNFIWAKSMGAAGFDMGTSITLDNQGNVYTTGSFQGRVDFDPGPDSSYLVATGNDDIFIQKLDANGNFIWARSMQGTGGSSGGESIAVDNIGNIYTTGLFKDSVDFDPNSDSCYLVSAGNHDIFIQKLRPETNLSINKIEPSNILFYPNPATNQVTLEWTNTEDITSTSKVVIYNALGQVVYQKLVSDNSFNINTQDWNPGMYICKLYQNEENIFTEKFVVIK